MKNEKGVTIVTIVVYCIILMVMIGIISAIRSNAESNMRSIIELKGAVPEINKLSMYMIEETKDPTNGIKKISADRKTIEFKSGNIYVWADNGIYKVTNNKKIRICEEINDCIFEYDVQNSKEILKVTMQLAGSTNAIKTMEYVFVPAPTKSGAGNENLIVGHLSLNFEEMSEPGNGEYYVLDEEIDLRVTITNDGNITLTDIYVTSELTGREWTIASLAPGQHSEVFIDNYSVTDLDISEGVITFVYEIEAESPDPDNPEYYDTVEFVSVFEYEEPNPYISIENVIISEPENGYGYALGETIEIDIRGTNEGNITLYNVIVESELTGGEWTIASLAPGMSKVLESDYMVEALDVYNGYVEGVVTATGTLPSLPYNSNYEEIELNVSEGDIYELCSEY